jgi:hypothetical protein
MLYIILCEILTSAKDKYHPNLLSLYWVPLLRQISEIWFQPTKVVVYLSVTINCKLHAIQWQEDHAVPWRTFGRPCFYGVPETEYNLRRFGFTRFWSCPSSGILRTLTNTTFRKPDLIQSSDEGVGDTYSVWDQVLAMGDNRKICNKICDNADTYLKLRQTRSSGKN